MAYGIDIFAQRKALELGLDTVSCLAHDLNHMYPRQHQRYCSPIAAQGALVSEFLPGAPFERSNFVRRNRIIAGLAQATIVIETGTSGEVSLQPILPMTITARCLPFRAL